MCANLADAWRKGWQAGATFRSGLGLRVGGKKVKKN